VVIDDCDIFSVLTAPAEDNTKLVIDPNGILADKIAGQSFEAVAGRRSQIFELRGGVKHAQFTSRGLEEIWRKALRARSTEDSLLGFTFETFNHAEPLR